MHMHLLSWSIKRPMKACEPHKGIGLGTKEIPVRFLALEIKTWTDCWSVENVVHTVRIPNEVALLHGLVMCGDISFLIFFSSDSLRKHPSSFCWGRKLKKILLPHRTFVPCLLFIQHMFDDHLPNGLAIVIENFLWLWRPSKPMTQLAVDFDQCWTAEANADFKMSGKSEKPESQKLGSRWAKRYHWILLWNLQWCTYISSSLLFLCWPIPTHNWFSSSMMSKIL